MSTTTTKPKVDVKAIMAKASKKIAAVKSATNKMDEVKDGWRILPVPLSKYEFNGRLLRNATTKRFMSPKAKNQKFQLITDDGKNVDRSKEDIIALLPKEEKAPGGKLKIGKVKKDRVLRQKEEKAPKAKKERKSPVKAAPAKKIRVTVEGPNREIKYHHIPNPMPLDKIEHKTARAIMADETKKSKQQIEELFFAGIEREAIVAITGRRDDVVAKYIRHLKR